MIVEMIIAVGIIAALLGTASVLTYKIGHTTGYAKACGDIEIELTEMQERMMQREAERNQAEDEA